jgi:hypothetical protein
MAGGRRSRSTSDGYSSIPDFGAQTPCYATRPLAVAQGAYGELRVGG